MAQSPNEGPPPIDRVRSSKPSKSQRDGSTLGFLSTFIVGPLVYLAGLALLATVYGVPGIPLELIGFKPWQVPFGAFFWLQVVYLVSTELPPLNLLKRGKCRIGVERASLLVSVGGSLASLAFSLDYFITHRSFGASAQALLGPWLQHQIASVLVQGGELLFFSAVVVWQALMVKKQLKESS